MVDVYINERSLEGQYCNDFRNRLSKVVQNVRNLQENVHGGVSVFVARSLFDSIVCSPRKENFSTFLCKNNECKKQFQLMSQKAKIIDISYNNVDIYSCGDLLVDNSSISEAYDKGVQEKVEATYIVCQLISNCKIHCQIDI